jgi:hypothetical protein
MSSFSEELRLRLIKYLKTKYDIQITSEQAEDFLSSLANLYLAMSGDEKEQPSDKP